MPVIMVLKLGNLGDSLASSQDGGIFQYIQALHWRIILDIFSIIPPSLLLAGIGFFCWSSLYYWKNSRENFRQQLFLFCFFSVSYVPFIKIFNEHVHLAYCLMPLSILLAKQGVFAWERMTLRPFNRITATLTLLTLVSVADHSVNIFSVRNVTREMYHTILSLSERFKNKLPRHSVIVSNAHHIEDIRFYTNGHIDPWNSGGAIPDQSHWLKGSVSNFRQKLKGWRANSRDVYFLDMRLPRSKGQRGAERVHTFVRDKIVNMKSLGRIATMRYSYPFFDPLRLLLPTIVSKWPGPPDLEFDYYRGPALSDTPFMSEVALDYYFYKVTGNKPIVIKDWKVPTLLKQDVMGFNIIGFQGMVYAIPQTEGAFDINRVYNNKYSRIFKGRNVAKVTRNIRLSLGLQPINKKVNKKWRVPTLLEQGVLGFNIVGYQGKVYAIPQAEGAFSLQRISDGDYTQVFGGKNLATVRLNIEKTHGRK